MVALVTFLTLAGTVRDDELSSSLLKIAQLYLKSRCLSFLFPLNFSNPSLIDLPIFVRSPLLKSLHQDWAVNLPAVNTEIVGHPFIKPGPICFLHCSQIIILEDTIPYVDQINQMLFTFYSNKYEDGGGNKTRIVVIVPAEISLPNVYQLLYRMFEMGEIDVILVAKKQGIITIFTLFPYGMDLNSCPENNTSVVTLDRWVDGGFEVGVDLFPNKIPEKFNSCRIKVGTMDDPPHIITDETGNIFDGIEYRIVEQICFHLGLSTFYEMYTINDSVSWEASKQPYGMRTDLRMGRVWMIVSGYSNLINSFSINTVSHTYFMNHLAWFFRNPKQLPNWKLIILTFDSTLWIFVLAATVAFPIILNILAIFMKRKNPFQRMSTSVMVSLGLLFANPSSIELKGYLFRITFVAWLFYTIHVNLAYSAALTSLLITGKFEPKITSFEQIVQRNLRTVMTGSVSLLSAGIEEPNIKKVLSNRIVTQNVTYFLLQQDFDNFTYAFLVREQHFLYAMKIQNLPFYASDLKLGVVYLGLKMRRNHFLINKIADLSRRVQESGFIEKYNKEYFSTPKKSNTNRFQSFKLKDLSGAFLLFAFGCTISLVVFIWEILIHWKQIKDIQPGSLKGVDEFHEISRN